MTCKLISTVIPTFNYGRFVTAAVESALAQTIPAAEHEIIVVDDGSRDDTRERLRGYEDRITYIYKENGGLSSARNTGITAARGEWIALLDSDDVWHPRKLEVQSQYVWENPHVGLVASGYVEGETPPATWPPIDAARGREARLISREDLVIRSRFGPSGVLINRRCFGEVGAFDVGLHSAEDRDMWIRIACRYPVAFLPEPLWWYRHHGDNMSKNAKTMEDNERKVLGKAFSEPAERGVPAHVRLKALSYASYSSAVRYEAAGMRPGALAKLIHSFLLWPIPFGRAEIQTPLARPRKMALLLLRMVRGSRTANRSPAE